MGVGGERQPVVAHLGGREPTGRLRGHQQAQAWIVRDGRELAAVPLDHHVGRGGRDRVEQSGTVVDGHLGCGCEPPGAHVEQRAGQPQVVAALYAHTRREQRRARTCGVLEHPARMLGRLDLPDRRRDVCRAARRLHRSAGLVGRTSVAPSLSDTSTVLTASSVRDGTDTSVSGRRAAVERIPAEPVWLPLPARR